MRNKKDTDKIITGTVIPKPKSCSTCPYIGKKNGCPFCQ